MSNIRCLVTIIFHLVKDFKCGDIRCLVTIIFHLVKDSKRNNIRCLVTIIFHLVKDSKGNNIRCLVTIILHLVSNFQMFESESHPSAVVKFQLRRTSTDVITQGNFSLVTCSTCGEFNRRYHSGTFFAGDVLPAKI